MTQDKAKDPRGDAILIWLQDMTTTTTIKLLEQGIAHDGECKSPLRFESHLYTARLMNGLGVQLWESCVVQKKGNFFSLNFRFTLQTIIRSERENDMNYRRRRG